MPRFLQIVSGKNPHAEKSTTWTKGTDDQAEVPDNPRIDALNGRAVLGMFNMFRMVPLTKIPTAVMAFFINAIREKNNPS